MSNVLDQLQGAALSLVRCGSMKDRLTRAWRDHLADIDAAEVPDEFTEDFIALRRSLNRERPLCRNEDSVHATVRKMSNDEAGEAAAAIVTLFAVMSRQSTPRAAPALRLYAGER